MLSWGDLTLESAGGVQTARMNRQADRPAHMQVENGII
jgi:hypothetical protein